MDTQEAYKELGLDPSASDAQLKATWRRLVAAWHPDRNAAAGAGRRMQHINKAYQHIRQLRDGDGHGSDDAGDESTEAAHSPTSATPETEAPGNTHVRKVRLSLEEAILGCTRTLRGHFTHTCDTCVGMGQRVLAQACGTCRGSGAVRKAALFGWLWSSEACADCGGDGRQRAPCDACDGSGERAVAYRRRVRFPAGLREGHVLSVSASRLGDREIGLELQVEIEPHPFFTLDDDGVLRCEMPVNGYAWMAGRWVDVPTPDGAQQLRLNRDALVYRLRGQGFPSAVRGPRGDYHVKVVPVFPTQEDPVQEALLDQLIASSTRAAEADRTQPLGQWHRRMKRWSSSKKEQARDH
ncbi:MAG: DnaJ C-terminal domain-containing protein [Burkholderiaceae bacterium]|nr:DnaJ C-terminal domain-containing protein [Burkholderiaceae bacterium]